MEDSGAACSRRDRYCNGPHLCLPVSPPNPAAETFAISTELARGVRNAILLAGYESETADIKATVTLSSRFYIVSKFEMNNELCCIALIILARVFIALIIWK